MTYVCAIIQAKGVVRMKDEQKSAPVAARWLGVETRSTESHCGEAIV